MWCPGVGGGSRGCAAVSLEGSSGPWCLVWPGVGGASCSSPCPAGGCWPSPKIAPFGRESSPAPPPQTGPSAPLNTAAGGNRNVSQQEVGKMLMCTTD